MFLRGWVKLVQSLRSVERAAHRCIGLTSQITGAVGRLVNAVVRPKFRLFSGVILP